MKLADAVAALEAQVQSLDSENKILRDTIAHVRGRNDTLTEQLKQRDLMLREQIECFVKYLQRHLIARERTQAFVNGILINGRDAAEANKHAGGGPAEAIEAVRADLRKIMEAPAKQPEPQTRQPLMNRLRFAQATKPTDTNGHAAKVE